MEEERVIRNNNSRPRSNFIANRCRKRCLAQWLATLAACTVTFTTGGCIAFYPLFFNEMFNIMKEYPNSDAEDVLPWISFYVFVCLPIGAIVSACLGNRVGRRRLLLYTSACMFCLWFSLFYSEQPTVLLASYLMIGMTAGASEVTAQTYVSEISESAFRSLLSGVVPCSMAFGTAVQSLMARFIYWRRIAIFNLVMSLLSIVVLYFMPESPHWLINRSRMDEARKSLRWLRGWTVQSEVQMELRQLRNLLEPDGSLVSLYCSRRFLKSLLKLSVLFLISCFNGMAAMIGYGPMVLAAAFHDAPLGFSNLLMAVSIVKLVSVVTFVILTFFISKKKLCSISLMVTGICLLIVSICGFTDDNQTLGPVAIEWPPLIFILLAIFASGLGIRNLPWVIFVELFPVGVRSVGAGLSVAAFYCFQALENEFFFTILYGLGGYGGLFLFYTVINVISSVVVFAINTDVTDYQIMVQQEGNSPTQNNEQVQLVNMRPERRSENAENVPVSQL